MHTKYPSIHDRPQSEVVKHLAAPPPHVTTAVLPLTFVVESIHLRNLPRFMVSSDECYAVWVSDFEGEEKQKSLHAVETSINEIAFVNEEGEKTRSAEKMSTQL